MWYKVRPAQRCVISVQRCFSCCVTTGSFSFVSRVGCCSLQTSSCPRLPGLAPAVGAVCCISWNKCRLWSYSGVLTCRAMQSFSFQGVLLLLQCWQWKSSPSSCQDCAASVQMQLPGIVSTPACSGLL